MPTTPQDPTYPDSVLEDLDNADLYQGCDRCSAVYDKKAVQPLSWFEAENADQYEMLCPTCMREAIEARPAGWVDPFWG